LVFAVVSPLWGFCGFYPHRGEGRHHSYGKKQFPRFSFSFLITSLNSLPAHIFVEVSSHLMKIETAINIPLGLPLIN
jgi:hypothetical protein